MAQKRIWTVASVMVAVFGVTTLALFLFGVRGFIVETPSMGQTAPVGSLILTAPAQANQVKVGDIISFKPDQTPNEVYTHRVVKIDFRGIHTQGDINGAADPWSLHQNNLLGKVGIILPVMGWVIKALPILAMGFGVVWIGTMYIPAKAVRSGLRTLGVSGVIAYTVNLIKPLISYVVLTQTPTVTGMTSRVVSTGLIPVQFSGSGSKVILSSGQVGNVQSIADPKTGLVHLTAAMHLDTLGWVILISICAIPTVWSLVTGLRHLVRKHPVDEATELAALVGEKPAAQSVETVAAQTSTQAGSQSNLNPVIQNAKHA